MFSFARSHLCTIGVSALAALAIAAPAAAQKKEDTGVVGPSFKEGDVITFEKIDSLKPFLPPEFWNNRDFFFYEGMKLEIGPSFRDYSPAAEFQEATKRFAGQAKIGPDGSLENYTAGEPFPMDQIDCKGDPQAGVKIMWNFDYQWEGDGAQGASGGGAGDHYSPDTTDRPGAAVLALVGTGL